MTEPRPTIIWTLHMEAYLIDLVRGYPEVWDKRHEAYTKKIFKKELFKKIAAAINQRYPQLCEIDAGAAQAKFTHLKYLFKRELTKLCKVKSGSGKLYRSKWYLFENLIFLVDSLTQGNSNLNLERTLTSELITADSIFDSSSIYESGFGDDEDSVEKPPPIFSLKSTSKIASLPVTGASTSRHPYRPGPACSKKRKKASPTLVADENNEDEFEAFGKSVSAQLRKLSLSRALRVQTEIQKILTEERISDLGIIANSSSTPSPTPTSMLTPEPALSVAESVASTILTDVSSSSTKLNDAACSLDSDASSARVQCIDKSVIGNASTSIKTESFECEPITEEEGRMPVLPSATADSSSLPLGNISIKPESISNDSILEEGEEMSRSSSATTDSKSLSAESAPIKAESINSESAVKGEEKVTASSPTSGNQSLSSVDLSLKMESIIKKSVLGEKEQMSSSSTTTDCDSVPIDKQASEIKAPEAIPQKDDDIEVECEIISLEVEDPLKGTG